MQFPLLANLSLAEIVHAPCFLEAVQLSTLDPPPVQLSLPIFLLLQNNNLPLP